MTKQFAVSAYIVNDAGVLLGKHVKQQSWVPVGGKIEPNESPTQAVVREVLEETKLSNNVDYTFYDKVSFAGNLYKMEGFLAYHEYCAKPSGTHMCFSFMLMAKHRDIVLCDEFTEHKWFRFSDVLTAPLVPPNVYQLLMKCFSLIHKQ